MCQGDAREIGHRPGRDASFPLVLPFLAHLPKRERVAFLRNVLRFPMLAILLGYATVPLVSGGAPFGPMITTAPGPWAGFVGAAGCVLGLVVYTVAPFLRRRPLSVALGDVHFYLAALACMGLFFGLFRAGSDAMFIRDPEVVARFAGYVRLRALSGWVLCATAALPFVAIALRSRARRTPSSTTAGSASPEARDPGSPGA